MGNIWQYSLTVFMAFFAIMNPIVNIPIFIKITEGLTNEKKRQISKTATLVAFIIVSTFILLGKYIFEIFGLSIPAFKVFGGILIFFIGFEMLQSKKQASITMMWSLLTKVWRSRHWQFPFWQVQAL